MTDNVSLIDIIADLQANGWDYGTHPHDKAMKVIEAVRQYDAENCNSTHIPTEYGDGKLDSVNYVKKNGGGFMISVKEFI